MNQPKLLILLFLLLLYVPFFGQSVAVNTDGASGDASAMLDVQADDKGILIPRLNTAQREGIASPAEGLMVYDTDFGAFWHFDGTDWFPVGGKVSEVSESFPAPGTIRWNDSVGDFQGFNGQYWQSLTGGGIYVENVVSEEQKIFASDGQASDYFGSSVAIEGNYAIVGAYRDDDGASEAGAAYIFFYDGASWVEQAKLTASDASVNANFGYSVALSGDYAIVGAQSGLNAGGVNTGAAYVFLRTGTSWTEQAKLLAADGALGDRFGSDVSISGDYALIGSQADDDLGTNSGSAYIFLRTGTSWAQQAKLNGSTAYTNSSFGEAVSLSGDYALIGARRGFGNGTAYIFFRTGTSWTEQAAFSAPDAGSSSDFGVSVSLDGDVAVVGASRADGEREDEGSVYVFERNGTDWEQVDKLSADVGLDDGFGSDVSLAGDYLIVGAAGDDDKGSNSGSAYLFEYIDDTWVLKAKLTTTAHAEFDQIGASRTLSIDVSGSIIIGTIRQEGIVPLSGAAYFYQAD